MTMNYEKLDDVFIRGEAHWASVFEINPVTDLYEITIIPDSLEEVKELGVKILTGFKDQNGNLHGDSAREKVDDKGNPRYEVAEDGIEFVKIVSSKNAKYGPRVMFDDDSVVVRDDDGHVVGPKIGNGSKVLVKCDLARTQFNKKQFIALKRPSKVRVIDLVTFDKDGNRDSEMYD